MGYAPRAAQVRTVTAIVDGGAVPATKRAGRGMGTVATTRGAYQLNRRYPFMSFKVASNDSGVSCNHFQLVRTHAAIAVVGPSDNARVTLCDHVSFYRDDREDERKCTAGVAAIGVLFTLYGTHTHFKSSQGN